MRRKVGKNVFKTNSSSAHAICVTKNDILNDIYGNEHIVFHIGNFGWNFEEFRDVNSKAKYLYTAILYNDRFDLLKKLKNILHENNISYTFIAPVFKQDITGKRYLFNGYIDHGSQLGYFIEDLCNDQYKLLRYLFSTESFVLIGNNNSEKEVKIKEYYPHDTYGKGC